MAKISERDVLARTVNGSKLVWPLWRGKQAVGADVIDFTGFHPPRADAGYPLCRECNRFHPAEDGCLQWQPGLGCAIAPRFLMDVQGDSGGSKVRRIKLAKKFSDEAVGPGITGARFTYTAHHFEEVALDLINGGGVVFFPQQFRVTNINYTLKAGTAVRWVGNPDGPDWRAFPAEAKVEWPDSMAECLRLFQAYDYVHGAMTISP